MKNKLGFSLGAGGSRGVAHIGFLQAMEEWGIVPDYLSGCSMGAMVGGCYAMGMTPLQMKEIVLKLRLRDLADFSLPLWRGNGLFIGKKITDLLHKWIGNPSFSDTKIPFICVATDLIEGKTVLLKEGDLIQSMIASSSIPTIFPPVEKDGALLIDGGILDRVPASYLKEMGADKTIVIDVLGNLQMSAKPKNALEILLRMIDVSDNHHTLALREKREDNIDLWLEANLGTMNQYRVKNLNYAYDKGYELGKCNAYKVEAIQQGKKIPNSPPEEVVSFLKQKEEQEKDCKEIIKEKI